MTATVERCDDTADLVQRAIQRVERVVADAANRDVHIMLAGGSTPAPIYAGVSASLPWSRVHVHFGDERCVAADDALSNYRMARETLLQRVPIAPHNVHRIRGELSPSEAARRAEQELREVLPEAALDLVILGMGADGHTASLFPGTAALAEQRALFTDAPGPSAHRITATVPLLCGARQVLFAVTGAAKAAPAARAIEGPPNPAIPASLIRPATGQLTWLLDPAAAAALT